jgi:TRAP-type uncharacterized transport system fused permease subunit
MFMLVSPDTTVGVPMTHDQAATLVAQIPPELKSTILEQTLDTAVLTTALLSAHMIIFWLSQDSNVTPPVCLTAFAAAAIAHTPPMATGLTAWKIAKGLYIVPLLFAYTPFLAGDPLTALVIFAFGTVGIYCLTAAIEGYAETRLNWPLRAVLAAVGVLLLWPVDLPWKLAGCAVFAGAIALAYRLDKRASASSR